MEKLQGKSMNIVQDNIEKLKEIFSEIFAEDKIDFEVLKLLQKTYHGKIKMIYIDPPYNTGKDFIYPDNYKDGINNYLKITGQLGEEGQN